MPQIKINRVLEDRKPYSPKGKDYTIYEYYVDGTIDGEDQEFTVKTFSEKIANDIGSYEGSAEVDEYKGRTSYKISAKTQKQEYSHGQSKPQDDKDRDASFALSYSKDIVCALVSAGVAKTIEDISKLYADLADRGLLWLRTHKTLTVQPELSWVGLITPKLKEEIKAAGVTKSTLDKAWDASGKDLTKFLELVKAILNGDDLPF